MSYKEYIPRILLYTGSIFIFISIFLEWAIITNIMTGDTIIDYGYDRLEIIIFFVISFIPIILYEKGIRSTAYYILIILVEIFVFATSYRMYLQLYTVETGIGYYFALTGGLLQIIGIFSVIIIERMKNKMRPRPTAPSR